MAAKIAKMQTAPAVYFILRNEIDSGKTKSNNPSRDPAIHHIGNACSDYDKNLY